MRANAPSRDIKTAEALKQVLLSADTIVFNNVASGNYFAKVLERLGIAEAVKAKIVRTAPREVYERILPGSGDDIAFLIIRTGDVPARIDIEIPGDPTALAGLRRRLRAWPVRRSR